MTDTIDAEMADEVVDQQQPAEQLLAQARMQGVDLVGPGGLLIQITKRVLEAALEAKDVRAPGLRQTQIRRPGRRELP